MCASFFSLLGEHANGLWFPDSASTFSEESDSTYFMILWICVVFFIGILYPLVYFPLKYGKRKGEKATSRVRHHNLLEISWSVFPSFLLVVMFVRGSWGFLDHREPPAGAAEVGVTAISWGWSFNYGGGIISPELHVVKDEPTRLVMRSGDVLHSLFIPAFRVKRDVVPGRYSVLWFEPTMSSEKVSAEELAAAKARYKEEAPKERDTPVPFYQFAGFTEQGYKYYDLYCTEYCGRDHSMMQTVVVVHETREDFLKWREVADSIAEGELPADYGRKLYEQRNCVNCHSLDGTRKVGPSFQGLFGTKHAIAGGGEVTVDEEYVRESILNPQAKIVAGYEGQKMPSYKGQLNDEKIGYIIEFLKSQK